MADFYSILKRTIEALPVATGQARRAVYDRARVALNNQLALMNPRLPPSEVSRQRLILDDSIRVIEEDFLSGKIILDSERENARRVAEMEQRDASLRVERTTRVLQEEAKQVTPSQLPREETSYNLQRPSLSDLQSSEQRRAASHELETEHYLNSSHDIERSSLEHQRIDEERVDYADRISVSDSSAEISNEYSEVKNNHSVIINRRARNEYVETPNLDDPFYEEEYDEDIYETANNRGDARSSQRHLRNNQGQQAVSHRGSSFEDYDDSYFLSGPDYQYDRPKRRVWPWIVLFIFIISISASGYYVYTNLDEILPKVERLIGMEDSQVDPLNPQISGEQIPQDSPRRIPLEEPNDGADNTEKASDRLLDDQGNMNPSVDSSTNSTIDQSTLSNTAILYEEGANADENRVFRGKVSWRLQQQENSLPVVIGRIDVPGRNLSIDLTFRKNQDISLSASHLIELSFAAPPESVGSGVQDIPAIMLKQREETQGELLTSVSMKVSDTLFWIALSAGGGNVERNINLLSERSWFDIPVLFGNGRRAIITLEKGTQGIQVFSQALQAWENDTPALQ